MLNSPPPRLARHVSGVLDARAVHPSYVANDRLMLILLAEGQDLVRMTRSAGWPARRIHLFASRHGYLFAADGTPYRPPAFGEQPRRPRRPRRSTGSTR
jgi:hypothetical protein